MFAVSQLEPKKIADVAPGQFVLYWHGSDWKIGLRIIGPGEDEFERHALIVMPFEVNPDAHVPVVFSEVGDERCLLLREAMLTWTGRADTLIPASEAGPQPGYLQLTSDGVALSAIYAAGYRQVAWWNCGDGKRITPSNRGVLIREWFVAAPDLDRKQRTFLSYPHDFGRKPR